MRPTTSKAALVAILALSFLAPLSVEAGGPRSRSAEYQLRRVELSKAQRHKRLAKKAHLRNDATREKLHSLNFAKATLRAEQARLKYNAKNLSVSKRTRDLSLLKASFFGNVAKQKHVPRRLKYSSYQYKKRERREKNIGRKHLKAARKAAREGKPELAAMEREYATRSNLRALIQNLRSRATDKRISKATRYANQMKATVWEKFLNSLPPVQKATKAPATKLSAIGTALAKTTDGPTTPTTEAPAAPRSNLPAVVAQPQAQPNARQAMVQKRLARAISIAERILRLPSLPQDPSRLNKLLKIVAVDKVAGMLHDTGVQLDPRSTAILSQAQRRIVAARRGNDPGPGAGPASVNPTIVTGAPNQEAQHSGGALVPVGSAGALVPVNAAPQGKKPQARARAYKRSPYERALKIARAVRKMNNLKPASLERLSQMLSPAAVQALAEQEGKTIDQRAKGAFEQARQRVAKALGQQPQKAADQTAQPKQAQERGPGSYRQMKRLLRSGALAQAFAEYENIRAAGKKGGFFKKLKSAYARFKLRREAKRLGMIALNDGSAAYDQRVKNALRVLVEQAHALKAQAKGDQNNPQLQQYLAQVEGQIDQIRQEFRHYGPSNYAVALKVLRKLDNQRKRYEGRPVAGLLTSFGRLFTGAVLGTPRRSLKALDKALISEAKKISGYGVDKAEQARQLLLSAKGRGLNARYGRKYKRAMRKAQANLKKAITKGVKEGMVSDVMQAYHLLKSYQIDGVSEQGDVQFAQNAFSEKEIKRMEKDLGKAANRALSRLTKQVAWQIKNQKIAAQYGMPLETAAPVVEAANVVQKAMALEGKDLPFMTRRRLAWINNRLNQRPGFFKKLARVPGAILKAPFRLLGAMARGGEPPKPPMSMEDVNAVVNGLQPYTGQRQQEAYGSDALAQAQQGGQESFAQQMYGY